MLFKGFTGAYRCQVGYLHNCFNLHVYPSLRCRCWRPVCPVTLQMSTVTDNSCLVCVKYEIYAFLLTVTPFEIHQARTSESFQCIINSPVSILSSCVHYSKTIDGSLGYRDVVIKEVHRVLCSAPLTFQDDQKAHSDQHSSVVSSKSLSHLCGQSSNVASAFRAV